MQAERKLAVMQPYFLPYLGYFQLMAKADAFVAYDDVNFINRGWINRNRINVNGDAHLFTVPLRQASQNRLICDIEISEDNAWRTRLLKSIRQAYSRASEFPRVMPLLEQIIEHPARNLAEYVLHSLTTLRDHFALKTHIVATSRCYDNAHLRAQARIIDICRREQADVYVNSIGGTELYERAAFAEQGITLRFLNPVLKPHAGNGGAFLPGLSIVDVLMHNDPEAVADLLHAGTLS
ncbi:WbqC family protein [Paraburkholderia acidipaludis]|uniref:WbqC family protein n=1 Tax=Paraburkholderia acidipaludis TaxID=660537 RepID=UPI0005BD266E|nr:WbqC family protein [Paraburkholderia acidipaludis]